MSDLSKKLEDAKRWLLSAVPSGNGRADRNPLYVILRDLIDELDNLKEEIKKYQLTYFSKVSVSGSNTEPAKISKGVTYVISPDIDYQELQERIDALHKRIEEVHSELEDKMLAGITAKLEAMYKKVEEDRATLEEKFKKLEGDVHSALAELVKMIIEE